MKTALDQYNITKEWDKLVVRETNFRQQSKPQSKFR
jgi:hypothetical protein